jgi:hypothetical protein
MRGKHKEKLLHSIAQSVPGYVSAYKQVPISKLMRLNLYSVEHLLPLLTLRGSAPSPAENDPLGWIEATRSANSERGHLPLVLWLSGKFLRQSLGSKVVIDGQTHYLPPAAQRARIARKWLYIRTTYPNEVSPMSEAQDEHFLDILTTVIENPPSAVEIAVNQAYLNKFGWCNPLCVSAETAKGFYDDAAWRWLARVGCAQSTNA